MNKHLKSAQNRIALCSIFMFIGFFCQAQEEDMIWTGGVQCQGQFVKHFEEGTTVSAGAFDIDVTSPAGGPATWQFVTTSFNPDCSSLPMFAPAPASVPLGGNLTATFLTAPTNRIRISSSGSIVAGEYFLGVRLSYGGAAFRVRLYRFIVRDPTDIVFVLDRSGSMECDLDEVADGATWDGCATGNTGALPDRRRWDILKESIGNFVEKLDIHHTVTGDRLSVVYFSGNTANGALVSDAGPFANVSNFRDPIIGGKTVIEREMEIAPIQAAANPRLARDGTSIGAGLAKAFGTPAGVAPALPGRYGGASTTGRRQIVVLFTDGEQNVGNWVREAGAGLGKTIELNAGGAAWFSLDNPAISAIDVFTAGVINVPSAATLLDNIADGALGDHYFNVLPGDEMQFSSDLATHVFNQIFNQTSPQLIRVERRKLGETAARADFTCNKNANRVILEAYFDAPVAKRCSIIIEKDGVPVTQFATGHRGDYIATFAFNMYALPDLSSDGKWSISVVDRARSGANVSLFATADDHAVDFDGYLNQRNALRVGEKLHPSVKLFENGTAVSNAEVKAIILKPGDDIGDLLARTQAPSMPTKSTEVGTCGGQKYGYLQANNPAVLERLKEIQQTTITLTDKGNGEYAGIYDDVDVTGVYKVIYRIKYNSPAIGEVERMKEQTLNVLPAPIVFNLIPTTTNKDGNKFLIANVTPAYKSGNTTRRVGPSYENAFGVEGNGVKLTNVSDNCDGSYRLTLTGNLDAPMKLYLLDEKIYSGTANNIAKPASRYKAQVSLHGGVTQPFGDLDSLYDGNFFAEVDFGYHLWPGLSLEAVGGYYNFQKDYSITGGTLYLKGHFNTANQLHLTLAGGGGIYKPKNDDATSGYSLRVGVERVFSQRWIIGLDASYFNLPEPKISFGALGLGLKYRF
ncbi:MAG: VWA domain-containing protein [Saprospiraceae bacterium]|nr:VWA domain-containing protein [Saprospiraceae bacterium]